MKQKFECDVRKV